MSPNPGHLGGRGAPGGRKQGAWPGAQMEEPGTRRSPQRRAGDTRATTGAPHSGSGYRTSDGQDAGPSWEFRQEADRGTPSHGPGRMKPHDSRDPPQVLGKGGGRKWKRGDSISATACKQSGIFQAVAGGGGGKGTGGREGGQGKGRGTQTPGWHSGTATVLGPRKLLEGMREACGKGVRGPPTLSPEAKLDFEAEGPVGWGQGRDCCFQKNILEGQSEA